MNDAPDPSDALDAPDLVHWSPRHGSVVGGPHRAFAWPLTATGAVTVGALALGVAAVSALAIGVVAIGRFTARQARLGDVKIGRLEIGDLVLIRRNGRPF